MGFPLLDLIPLSFDLVQLRFVLLPDSLLLFFQGGAELRSVLNFLTSRQHLRVHSLDLVLKDTFLFLSLQEFVRSDLKGVDGCVFISFSLLFLLLQLRDLVPAHRPLLLRKFLLELFKLDLILPKERSLVQIFIDPGLVLDFFCSRGKLQRLV